MKYAFHIVDVFSSTPFGGNQLAVLPDAAGISTEGLLLSPRPTGATIVSLVGVALLVAAGEIKDKALRAKVARIVPAVAADPGRGATLGWTARF